VPGGNFGLWMVAGFGILASLFALFIGFVPPKQLDTGNIAFYEAFLFFGIILLSMPPFIFNKFKKPSWVSGKENDYEDDS
jgi:uncharacterized membrane protein